MAAVGRKTTSTSLYRVLLALVNGGRTLSNVPVTLEKGNAVYCRIGRATRVNSNSLRTFRVLVPLQRDTGQATLSPAVRFLVETNHLDPALIAPTGPKSRLLKGDVLKYLAEVKESEVQPSPTSTPVESSDARMPSVSQSRVPQAFAAEDNPYIDIPVSSVRKKIAKSLTLAKTTIPYSYATTSCTMDNLLLLHKQLMKEEDIKLTINDFIIKAAAITVERVPRSGASWSDGDIKLLPGVDISFAVVTDEGPCTPIIKGANRLKLQEISKQTQQLVAKAHSGTLQPHEHQGGSFTVSNLGMYGITEFSSILNPPQSAILAVGGVQPHPVVGENEDGVRVARTMVVTLSCDARVIDYELACHWLETFRKIMESPASLL